MKEQEKSTCNTETDTNIQRNNILKSKS